MPTRQTWFDGWRLFALLSLTLLALSIWIAGMRGFEVDGVRMVIRFTARTSLVLFLPRLLRRRAGTAVAEHVDPVAAPQPSLSRRQLRGFARHPSRRHCRLRGDGPRELRSGDLDRVLHFSVASATPSSSQ